MKGRVYIETTVVSYLTALPSRDLIRAARQELTHEWWQSRREDFEVYVSQLVIDEAGKGDPEAARRRLDALAGIPRLQTTDEAATLARAILDSRALPAQAVEDALHIALATVHGMDFLLTWNCSHLANAERIAGVRETIETCGYGPPHICTPEEMLGELG